LPRHFIANTNIAGIPKSSAITTNIESSGTVGEGVGSFIKVDVAVGVDVTVGLETVDGLGVGV
jgi:hypothetical protein